VIPTSLVALGTDGLLHVVDVDGEGHEPRLFARPEDGREILSPVWGPGGAWIAWSESDGVDGRVRVRSLDGDEIVDQPGFPAFCLDPSPDGTQLASLATGPLGLELSVVELETGVSTLVARGAPLYWAWGPSSRRLAVHVHRRVFVANLGVLGPGSAVEHDLLTEVDRFLAPWWSPAGGELILVDDRQRLSALSLEGEVLESIADGQPGYRFAVDPAGQRVALVSQHSASAVVEVVDRLTGERQTAIDEPVAGMWWSGDGARLLALVRAGDEGQPFVRWCVWDGEQTTLAAPFQPSRVVAETVLPFFEQFAFGHRFWSENSDAIVTPGIMRGGRPEIFVQTFDDRPPRPLIDGAIGWWRPPPAPEPGD